MSVLPRYFAIKSLEKLQSKLPKGQQKLLKELMGMLDADGQVNAVALREALFPVATSDNSANTMLRRLLDNVNDAALALGMVFRAETTADKKAGVDRRVWFEGAAEAAARPHTGDLNRIPEPLRANDQRGMLLGGVVVLMTFNQQETAAVREVFGAGADEVRGGRTYTRLGVHGEVEVVHVLSRKGRSEAQSTAQAALEAWNPVAVIPVGVAFGIDQVKQRIGDVLVSESLRDYEMARLNGDATVTPRGNRPQAADVLIDRIRHLVCDNRDASDWPEIRLGVLMCGDKLVDYRPFRDDLLKIEPEAIGGEMEGIGVETALRRDKVDWIVIKGICDWADGGKHATTKDDDQRLAAQNAARVAKALLETPNLFTPPKLAVPESPPAQPPAPAERGHVAPPAMRMGMRDCCNLPEGHLQRDAQGAPARLDGRSVETKAQGVAVLPYLHAWVADPGAPPLFALLGEYGMGKTITAQQLARELDAAREQDPTRPIPLYFDLRHVTRLDRKVPSLAEALEECMARGWLDEGYAAGYRLENVHRWIAQGAVAIFDGLDEVLVKLTDADGQVFTNGLLKLIADAHARARNEGRQPRLKVLITCRTQYFPTLQAQNSYFTQSERGEFAADKYRAVVLLPWGEAQVNRYLATALPEMDVGRVREMVASVHNLEELTQRPYTLRLVAEFIPDIEQERARGQRVYGVTLYRKMVEKWLARDSGKHHIRPDHKLKLAAHLAAYLWRTKQSALPASDLNNWFHQWRDGDAELRLRYATLHPDQLEEDLRTATFLSRQDDGDKSAFRFAHTSLQEFFLASYLLDALQHGERERWAMGIPSRETLDFIGQLLAENAGPAAMASLQGWRREYLPQSSELLLAYGLQATARGWPSPILHGIDLRGASLRGWKIEGGAEAPLDLGPANFGGADLRDVVFRHVRCAGANFAKARLGGANFLDCDARETGFDATELTAAIFRKCDLSGSRWGNARGYRAQWLLCQPESAVWADGPGREPGLADALMGYGLAKRRGRLAWLEGHAGRVWSCTWSPDGRRLASAGEDGTVRLWDAASGEALRALEGHAGEVRSCAWSPGGRQLASAGEDGSVRLWDAASGEALRVLEGHAGRVSSCAWSPDGRQLASAGEDGAVRLWDAASGEALRALEGHAGWVPSCAWSPDGGQLASAGSDGRVRLWDAASGEALRALEGHAGGVLSCAWSPDGRRLASAGVDGRVRLWDAASGEALRALEGHAGWVWSCAWSPDGRQLASAGADGRVRLWDAASGEALRVQEGHAGVALSCAWSPDGQQLASAGEDGSVRLWDAASGEALWALEGLAGWVWSCAWSPDGRQLASVGEDGSVRLWDAASGEALRALEGHAGRVLSCAWSPDGRQLASAGEDGRVRLWDAASGEALWAQGGHAGRVLSCAWSPDGRQLASAGFDGTVRLWDAASGAMLRIHAVCSRRGGRGGGYAVWQPGLDRIVDVSGEAWRYLSWQDRGADGWTVRLPLEMFGPVPGAAAAN